MAGAIFNIVVGALCIAAGASGRFVLLGTSSSAGLVVVGGCALGIGVFQLWRRRVR